MKPATSYMPAHLRLQPDRKTLAMKPTDIALIVILIVAVAAGFWLIANSRRHTSGAMDFVATWLATSLLVFIVGGGLAMFGVVVLYFVFGQQAAMGGLVLLAIALVLEPFIVAFLLYRRRGNAVSR